MGGEIEMRKTNNAYPKDLKDKESNLIDGRRITAGVSTSASKKRVGVGISGGGVRSATQALGTFQHLSDKDLLRHVDYVSTVSGGGYFGGFLGRLFDRDGHKEVAESLKNTSNNLKYLRNSGNYLAPNGDGDFVKALSIVLRNWVSLLVVMSVFFLSIFSLSRLPTGLLSLPNAFNVYGFWVSSYVAIPLVILTLGSAPLAWAYWLVNYRQHWFTLIATIFLAAVGVFVAVMTFTGNASPLSPYLWFPIGSVSISTLIYWLATIIVPAKDSKRPRNDERRDRLSSWLGASLILFGFSSTFVVIDSLGYFIYNSATTTQIGGLSALSSVILAVVGFSRKLAVNDGKGFKVMVARLSLPVLVFSSVVVLLALLSCASYFIAWRSGVFHPLTAVISFALLSVISLLWGFAWEFVNRSSYNELFSARITRSFLGAANDARISSGESYTRVHPKDDIMFTEYAPHDNGGPLHIINVTINETIDGRSKVHQIKRRGVGMAVGPVGMSAGVRHHALWKEGQLVPIPIPGKSYHVFAAHANGVTHAEPLTLGQWVGISAAAASSALGLKTHLWKSMMLALLNIRLGYWWDSGVGRASPQIFGVHRSMLKEFSSSFPGTAERRWYLTDGGHFENLAAYELVRRRVPIMVICDNEMDVDYNFHGLASLMRKARIDFGAEISFLDSDELDRTIHPAIRPCFGVLQDLKRSRDLWDQATVDNSGGKWKVTANNRPFSLAHASLARINYLDTGEECWLIYMKPTITGDEPEDIKQYLSAHPDFPNESTSDQFFDENQWESYRKLAEHNCSKVFADVGSDTMDTPFEWIVNGHKPATRAIVE